MAGRVTSGVVRASALVLSAVVVVVGPSVGSAAAARALVATTPHGTIAGQLGFEGGAYPGGFHATAGVVKVTDGPHKVKPVTVPESGEFTVHVVPGTYTLTGCGGTKDKQCGPPQSITVEAGATIHVQVVWLLAPSPSVPRSEA